MKNRDSFSGFHPIVNLCYFALVLVFSMVFMHPVSLFISCVCSILYLAQLRGGAFLKKTLKYMFPLLLTALIFNPAFNHEGVTVLGHFPTGSPLTIESIVFGLAAAVMLISVLIWFACCSEVLTSDKFIYLFGRIIPALSLVITMTMRFVPKFLAQLKVVVQAQKCVGRDVTSGSITQRIKNAAAVVSVMVTWSLENAADTADSMKSRGYGLPGRSAFSVYRFDSRDKYTLIWLLLSGGYVIRGAMAEGLFFQYYPNIAAAAPTPINISFQLIYTALCLTPIILNRLEDRKWKHIK